MDIEVISEDHVNIYKVILKDGLMRSLTIAPCCIQFINALKSLSSGYDYESLFFIDKDGWWRVGADVLDRPTYCPWCGKHLPLITLAK